MELESYGGLDLLCQLLSTFLNFYLFKSSSCFVLLHPQNSRITHTIETTDHSDDQDYTSHPTSRTLGFRLKAEIGSRYSYKEGYNNMIIS
ncbi:hypothetical protein YC2023_089955 [Brassica napus]